MKNRSELREICMRVLYQVSILEGAKLSFELEKLMKEQLEIENDFVTEIIHGVLREKETLRNLANQYLNNWSIDRLNKVDQAILEIGIYELKCTETPKIVAINEAVELSKKYSDEKVTKMINAVLDGIYKAEEDHAR